MQIIAMIFCINREFLWLCVGERVLRLGEGTMPDLPGQLLQ